MLKLRLLRCWSYSLSVVQTGVCDAAASRRGRCETNHGRQVGARPSVASRPACRSGSHCPVRWTLADKSTWWCPLWIKHSSLLLASTSLNHKYTEVINNTCVIKPDKCSLGASQTYPRPQNNLVGKLGLGGLSPENTIFWTGAVRTNHIFSAGFIYDDGQMINSNIINHVTK